MIMYSSGFRLLNMNMSIRLNHTNKFMIERILNQNVYCKIRSFKILVIFLTITQLQNEYLKKTQSKILLTTQNSLHRSLNVKPKMRNHYR